MKILISTSSDNFQIANSVCSALLTFGYDGELFLDDQSFYFSFFKKAQWSPFRKTASNWLLKHKIYISSKFYEKSASFKPDFILVIQGRYFLKEEIARIVDDQQRPVFNWLIHDPIFADFYDQLQIKHLMNYSGFFIADELWKPCVYFFGKPVIYLPLAGDSNLYYPKNLKKDIAILFVGDLAPGSPFTASGLVYSRVLDFLVGRNFPITAFVENIRLMKKFFPRLKKLNALKGASLPSFVNELYSRSKIVLNLFPLDYKKDFPASIFNTALSGNFQLAEYKDNSFSLFPESVLFFKSLSSLEELLLRFGGDEERRRVLADRAYQQAKDRHTYIRRAEEIIKNIYGR